MTISSGFLDGDASSAQRSSIRSFSITCLNGREAIDRAKDTDGMEIDCLFCLELKNSSHARMEHPLRARECSPNNFDINRLPQSGDFLDISERTR